MGEQEEKNVSEINDDKLLIDIKSLDVDSLSDAILADTILAMYRRIKELETQVSTIKNILGPHVICDHAGDRRKCNGCPHAIPHKIHHPNQTFSDGDKWCTEVDDCEKVPVKCIPVT
jgi:hypothetical protein